MDRLGNGMYVLGIMAAVEKLRTRLFPSRKPLPALGGIRLAGTIRSSQGVPHSKRRDLGSHALVYLAAGSGEYRDALGRREEMRAGDLIWLFPGLEHSYGPGKGGRWDEIYFVFDGPLADLWRGQKVITPERPVWRLEPVGFWFDRLEALALALDEEGWENAFHQVSRFQSLVADMLLASRGAEADAADRRWLARACGHLEASGPSAPGLEEVARLAGLSYESFRKKFARHTGLAPAQYRRARVIERACGLLMRRSHSHKEIAEQLGFCDEFHFSKAFRKEMGFSPHAFRLKALGALSAHEAPGSVAP